jgi:hypothetical protein
MLAMLLAGGSATAASTENPAGASVRVWISDSVGVSTDDVATAQAAADAILREAGIAPVWLQCGLGAANGRSSRALCERGVSPGEIVVRLLQSSPQDTSRCRVTLGEAVIDTRTHTGSIATVFVDRVVRTSARAGANLSRVMGRVIAHEIGHLLLGSTGHARSGLMRAAWTDRELRRAAGPEWHFSASEAGRMRALIVARGNRAGARSPGP